MLHNYKKFCLMQAPLDKIKQSVLAVLRGRCYNKGTQEVCL